MKPLSNKEFKELKDVWESDDITDQFNLVDHYGTIELIGRLIATVEDKEDE